MRVVRNDRNVLTRITDSLGRATTVGFDDFFRLTRIVDPEGIETTIGYNLLGNITSDDDQAEAGLRLAAVTETLDFKVTGCDGVVFDILLPAELASGRPGSPDRLLYNTLGQLTERTDPADADGVRKKTIIT